MSDIASPGEGHNVVPVTTTAPAHHQLTQAEWESIEHDADFQSLLQQKRSFVIPATIVFLVYYFGFLILVGYFPEVVDTNVVGNINIAYLFALSQFIMAWIVTYLYVRRAGGFDALAQRIVEKVRGGTVRDE